MHITLLMSELGLGRELCSSKPFMKNIKEISFDAIRNRTRYHMRSYEYKVWFECKYCSAKICCMRDDMEGDQEYETWTSIAYGEHHDHPEECEVRPVECYLELIVRQGIANGLSGQRLTQSVQQFFCYKIDERAIYYIERKASSRTESSQEWQKIPSLVTQLQGLQSQSRVLVDPFNILQAAYIELKTVKLLKSPAFVGVVFVDACHCSDTSKSTLCIACTLTGDHMIIPLAFVLGQGETKDNYCFLFSSLKHAMPHEQEVVIFSDECPGLVSAVEETMGGIKYKTKSCAFHILKKLPVKKRLFWDMVKADNVQLFEKRLDELVKDSPTCEERVKEIAKKHAYMGTDYVNALGIVSDSPVESLNAAITPWRKKEPIDMIIGITQWCNKQVDEQLRKLSGTYCQTCNNLLQYRKQFSDAMVIKENKDHTWTVTEQLRDGKALYMIVGSGVDLRCSCGQYGRDGIPCRHLLVLEARGSLVAPAPKPCYLSLEITKALQDTKMFIDESKIVSQEVGKPPVRKNPGRPRHRRYKSFVERLIAARKKNYRCAICKRIGHTAKTHDAWQRSHTAPPRGRREDPDVNQSKRTRRRQQLRIFKFDQKAYDDAQKGNQ